LALIGRGGEEVEDVKTSVFVFLAN